MKAIQLKELVKSPNDLKVSNLPDLQAAPDKYLIKIHAAATNFFDVLQIQGKHQQKPDFHGSLVTNLRERSLLYQPRQRES